MSVIATYNVYSRIRIILWGLARFRQINSSMCVLGSLNSVPETELSL